MDAPGASDLHRRAMQRKHVEALEAFDFCHDFDHDPIVIVIRIGQLTCGHVDFSGASDFHQVAISIERLGKRMEEVHDHGTIEPRLRCDRVAIVTPSWRNHLHELQKAVIGGSRSLSIHDRGSFEAKLWLNSWPIRKPRHHPKEPLPQPLQIASTTTSIAHDLRPNFPFKNPCILLLFLNF